MGVKECLDKAEFSHSGLGWIGVCPAGLDVGGGEQMLASQGVPPPPRNGLGMGGLEDRAMGG